MVFLSSRNASIFASLILASIISRTFSFPHSFRLSSHQISRTVHDDQKPSSVCYALRRNDKRRANYNSKKNERKGNHEHESETIRNPSPENLAAELQGSDHFYSRKALTDPTFSLGNNSADTKTKNKGGKQKNSPCSSAGKKIFGKLLQRRGHQSTIAHSKPCLAGADTGETRRSRRSDRQR